MQKRWLWFLFNTLVCVAQVAAQLQPVGRWREHLEFQPASRVTMGDDAVFVASKFGIYSVTLADNIIERYSKISGLNDIGISTLRYNQASGKLLIAYNNSNLDVLYRNDVINIPYIFRSTVSFDKRINDIHFDGNRAYLSTNLGVIVVNMDRYEISNTWYIGQNGAAIKVTGFTSDASFFYAATEEGLKAAPKNSNNLEDYRNWIQLSNANGLPNGPVRNALLG
jgi:hypothetical protein